MANRHYEEASVHLREALKRVPIGGKDKELELRKQLIEVFEKLEKFVEAAEQVNIIRKQDLSNEAQILVEKKTQMLRNIVPETVFLNIDSEDFRTVSGYEYQVVPLYCGRCLRLLSEAEVFAFRRDRAGLVRCFCGFEGWPFVRVNRQHYEALDGMEKQAASKARLMSAAQKNYKDGKKRWLAVLLAIFLGIFGAHKFYLGQKIEGAFYLIFSWTLLPALLGWFDAIYYSQMSKAGFNLNFNLDIVLDNLPDKDPDREAYSDVFSMQYEEEEEDPLSSHIR
jgi:TM2 domain-containing membrane protein YozV